MFKYYVQVSAFTPRGDFKGILGAEYLDKEQTDEMVDCLVNAIENLTKLSFQDKEGAMIVLTQDIIKQSVLCFKAVSAPSLQTQS